MENGNRRKKELGEKWNGKWKMKIGGNFKNNIVKSGIIILK